MGNRLKELIIQSGLKQYRIADMVGISGNSLSSYIMGIRKPKFDTAKKIAEILAKYLDREVESIFFDIYNLNYDKHMINKH